MPDKQLPAKLSRPRLFGVVDRERLFALLDEQRERPVVWIAGPPGAGKTTLVSTYLALEHTPTLWYRIDEGDADIATFFGYLAQAAGACGKGRKPKLPALTPEYLLDLPGFARRYFRTLFAAFPARSALVLDQYEAAAGSALDAIVNIAIAEAPPGVRLLVTSRAAPPAALGHLVAKGTLASLSWDDLRLSAAEAGAIAGSGPRTQAESVETLHALSDGWAAGFVVLLEHVRRAGRLDQHQPGAMHEALFTYFVNEMFRDADDATRVLLMRTALLPGFSGGLAAALCPEIAADAILERLYRQRYFLDRGTGTDPVYRYHALFRDFLLQEGRAIFAPDERRDLLVRAAALLVAHGWREDALALFTEAEAWQEAAGLLCELAPQWLHQGRYAPLERAIGALPESILDRIPWLWFWLGMARLPFAPARARASLEAAFAQFDAADDVAASMQACCGILHSYFVEWNDMRPVDRWGTVFQALSRREGVFPSPEAEIRALASLGALVFRASTHGAYLKDSCARLLELMALTADPELRLVAANFAMFHLLFAGEWRRLRRLNEEADRTLDLTTLPPLDVIGWHVGYCAELGPSGNFAKAFEIIARAQSLAETSGVRMLDVYIAGHGVYPALNCGDLARAERGIARMRAAVNPARLLDVCHIEWLECALAMARDDWLLAQRLAWSGLEKAIPCGAELPIAQHRLALAMTLIELGKGAAADAEIERLLEYAAVSGHAVFRHSGLMLKAYAHLKTGDMPAARETLRIALAMGREDEYVVLVPYVPAKVLQTLCAAALQAGIEVDYVRGLIRRLKMASPDPALDAWPWPVRICALGRFEVFKDGVPLQFGGKAQRKPMELLKALVGFGERGAPIDTLVEALWPESREGDGQKSFDITVHRLRKLLDDDEVITIGDRRAMLNPRLAWVDAHEVERLLARLAPPMPMPQPALPELERAAPRLLELYRGAFLGGEADPAWALAARDRLTTQFRRFILRLGEHWERAGRWAEAAQLYERGVELEPLAEALYRRQIDCLLQQEQPVEAIEVFLRCRKMLSMVLGVKPAPETEALYRKAVAAAQR